MTARLSDEGELGIVIGKRCKEVSEADAPNYIFGYTCSNDVTAGQLIQKDPTFAQADSRQGFRYLRFLRPGHLFRVLMIRPNWLSRLS